MNADRKTALVAGTFFIVAFVASVPGPFALYRAVLHDPWFIVTPPGDVRVAAGALLEAIVAIAVIGTAVTLFPVVRRQSEGIALGTCLLGPNLALGPNTLMLAYLMYRSRLVPRAIAILGLVGGPLLFAFATAVLFGVFRQVSVWGAIGALPVFAWEMSLAVWLVFKGFTPSAAAALRHRGPVVATSPPS